jgi:MYXO-CTERM domain-containing protein
MVPPLADFVVVISSDWPVPVMLDSTLDGYRPAASAVHYALYVGGCGERDLTETSEDVEWLTPHADAKANTETNATDAIVDRRSDDDSNAARVTSPPAAPSAETASTDDATLPAAEASGCAMTASSTGSITPFALALGVLAALRRRRRS